MASLEDLSEKIYNPNTKKYFEEVLSSYYNKNYRAAVVMLWSTLVYDLKLKLRDAHEIYGNPRAGEILKTIEDKQNSHPRSSAWELEILKEIKVEKSLINETEYEKLVQIQKERHLAAHPVIQDDDLITPNPSLVRGYIEYALEHIFIKPPIHIGNITNMLLERLPSESKKFSDKVEFRKFIADRYLKKIHENARLDLFKAFWKFTFSDTGNAKDEKNKSTYFDLLCALVENYEAAIIEFMRKNKEDFIHKISLTGDEGDTTIRLLIIFFSRFSNAFSEIVELEDPIVDPMKKVLKGSIVVSGRKHFLYDSSKKEEYLSKLRMDIEEDTSPLREVDVKNILQNNSLITLDELLNELSKNYGASCSFATANERFANQIRPLINLFNKDTIEVLLKEHSENSQCCYRHHLSVDYPEADAFILYNKAIELLGEDYDFSVYSDYFKQVQNYKKSLEEAEEVLESKEDRDWLS